MYEKYRTSVCIYVTAENSEAITPQSQLLVQKQEKWRKLTGHNRVKERSVAARLTLPGTLVIPVGAFPGLASGYRLEYPGLIAVALIEACFWSRSSSRVGRLAQFPLPSCAPCQKHVELHRSVVAATGSVSIALGPDATLPASAPLLLS